MEATASATETKLDRIDKDSIAYQGIFLGLIAGLATLVLLLVYQVTEETIAQRNREDQLAGLAQVLPAHYYQNDLLASQYEWQLQGKSYQVFVGKDAQGNITSYALQYEAQGFAGPIKLLMGLDPDFEILGLRVLEHSETPGLGDKIEIARDNWILSFNGLSLSNTPKQAWAVKKDGGQFDQFTGATITPRGIVTEVHHSLMVMKDELSSLINKEAGNE